MFPSDCVLERRVRTRADRDLAATDLPFFILRCEDRKADGYADDQLEIYNRRLKDMVIGVRLADAPPAVSYLAILGAVHNQRLSAQIVALDKTAIVIRLDFGYEGPSHRRSLSYLIYDAVALSLRMIPAPQDPSCPSVSLARPCHGPDYALVHFVDDGGESCLFLWRPSSSPSPPWSQHKKADIPYCSVNQIHTEFSFNGHAYWMDLLCGGFCFRCDALFDDNSTVVEFGGSIPLPVEPRDYNPDDEDYDHDDDGRMAQPAAYRTMGVVGDSFIRFVSIDGFHEYVQLKDRTMTVWKLLGHDEGWDKEHELSLETLWGFEGFGDVPKDLTPMYPLLGTNDADVVYLGLGGYRETKIVRASLPTEWEFFPFYPDYMLAIDMRNKIVRTSIRLKEKLFPGLGLVSCGFSRYLHEALVGPCDYAGTNENEAYMDMTSDLHVASSWE